MPPVGEHEPDEAQQKEPVDANPRSLAEAVKTEAVLGRFEKSLDAPPALAPSDDLNSAQCVDREHEPLISRGMVRKSFNASMAGGVFPGSICKKGVAERGQTCLETD